MSKKRGKGKKPSHWILNGLFVLIIFIIKIPYFIVRGIFRLVKKIRKKEEVREVRGRRESMKAEFDDFDVVFNEQGDYNKWVNNFYRSDSKIGIILGARGSGKTAFGIKLLENAHISCKKKCFAMGFHEKEMPSWINVVANISEIENNSLVLIDEGGVLFNSRDAMTSANKILGELMLIARHKNLSIIFISQNSSNLDVNILRQADFLVLKPSSLLQKEFERKIIQKIYDRTGEQFEKFKDVKGLTYIYSSDFLGFVSNSLPSFWKMSISKSFSGNK